MYAIYVIIYIFDWYIYYSSILLIIWTIYFFCYFNMKLVLVYIQTAKLYIED